jgi:serine/threonine protein kinase
MRCPHCGNRISDTLAASITECPVCRRQLRLAASEGADGEPQAAGGPSPDATKKKRAGSLAAKFDHRGEGVTVAMAKDKAKTPAKRAPGAGPADERKYPEKLGHFEVKGLLGEGGMGLVLDGYDPQLDRRVAIKVLSPRLAQDAGFVQRFLTEARAVARISHPNVAQVFFADSEDDQHFFVMEFIEGESLDDRVEKRGRLSPKAAIGYVMQGVRGLAAAHERGIVHRDIKPANLMLNREDEVKVTDFGLAKLSGENLKLTQAGTVLGSPHFMAPEQGRGQDTDVRADIYSLGATIYYLVTGKPPYEGDTALAVILKHQEAPVPQIARAPPSLNRLVGRMMGKDPAGRYPDYKELMKDLMRLDRSGLLRDEVLPTGEHPAVGAGPAYGAPAAAAPQRAAAEGRGGTSHLQTQRADDEVVLLSQLDAVMKKSPTGTVRPRGTTAATRAASGTAVRAARSAGNFVTRLLKPGDADRAGTPGGTDEAGAGASQARRLAVIGFVGAVAILLAAIVYVALTGEATPPGAAPPDVLDPEIEQLRGSLDDPNPRTRRAAAMSLGRYPGEQAEDILVRMLRDRDAEVRVEAARTLERMGRKSAVRRLVPGLSDESPDVRAAVAKALHELSGYDAILRIDWRAAPADLRRAIAEEFVHWWNVQGQPSP